MPFEHGSTDTWGAWCQALPIERTVAVSNHSQHPAYVKENVDFEAFYQHKPFIGGTDLAFEFTPWDIGEPQPPVVELERSGVLRGEILDAGCGLGENAIFLAQHGHRVVGVDASTTALDRARERAAQEGVEVAFVESDATRLAEFTDERFGTVLDCALYHCLGEHQQQEYLAALHRVSKPGAELHLLCWAAEEYDSQGIWHPMGISQKHLRASLDRYWDIAEIRRTHFCAALHRHSLTEEKLAKLEHLGVRIDPNTVKVDDKDRVTGVVWQVRATRR